MPLPLLEPHARGIHRQVLHRLPQRRRPKLGGLDLTSLPFDPANPTNFAQWVKVHDRLRAGEMPPKAVNKRPDLRGTDSLPRRPRQPR